jgi:4-diphosphocytidyl-2-C-methyl-D-erythritol kinase
VSTVCIKSYAKLNLYLRVLGKLRNNYHSIITVFERINLFDEVALQSRRDNQIRISCNNPAVPKGKSNLTYRAAHLLRKELDIDKGVNIGIIKRIPVASGLGGGSSNAAAVLIGLNRLWKLNLTQHKLVKYAKAIGADVPFFLNNTSFAIGRQRGDSITKLRINNKFWHIVVVPKLKIPTQRVYRHFNRLFGLRSLRLTNPLVDAKMLLLSLRKHSPSSIRTALFNHLEIPAFDLYPKLRAIRDKLQKVSLRDDLMISGSGASLFILVTSRKEGERLYRRLSKFKHWKTFLVRTA